MELTKTPAAKTAMLIRKPVSEVFEAFVDPAQLTQFWFTHGSGRLVEGRDIEWTWEMYDFTITVNVLAVEVNRRILIRWPGYGHPTTVEWVFESLSEDTTFVRITNEGFVGTGDEVANQAMESGQGFCWVLAGAKAYLEHGIRLGLVADRFPL